ncbi:hypothetical protein ACJ2A9_23310 [Anaerobacillus sp. MEB173]|uniref:hypothetical protein n=1 Tax=Anaerobacillus sp. MEB173 TaxID=3383345 RepID=UPI003F8DA297
MNSDHQSNFWNWLLFKRKEKVRSDNQEELITYINLSGSNFEERLVQTEQEVMVQRKDETGAWLTEYRTKKVIPVKQEVLSGYFNQAKQNIVIFFCWTGNGGFLTYTIIGRKHGKIVTMESNEFVYKGDIYFENGRLIEKNANRYSEWIVKNGRFKLIPYKVPEIPGALRIEYYIYPDERIKIDKTHFTAPVGSLVQAIRTDRNPLPEKGYIYPTDQSDDMVEYLHDRTESFRILKKGKIEMKIIPDDWGKGVPVTIEAI